MNNSMIRMSKYHIAILQICLCALFLCQGGRAEMCPPETLHVNFEAREIAKNVQFSIFGNDSVVPYIERYLQHWRGNVDAVEVVNAPPYSNTTKNNYYTYDNAKNGVLNSYTYTVGNKQYTCPVSIKVLDRYHPYCNGRKNEGFIPSIGERVISGNCSATKALIEDAFAGYAEQRFYECSAEYNDVMWSHQYEFAASEVQFSFGCERLTREYWIDWDNTYKDWSVLNGGDVNFDLNNGESREIKFYYVFFDESGNRALTNYATPCIASIKIKRTDFSNVEFTCPDYGNFFAGVEAVLPFPIVTPEQYVKWEKVTLQDAGGASVSTSINIEANGIKVKIPETPGSYTLNVTGSVCGAALGKHTVSCPIKVVEAREHCIK